MTMMSSFFPSLLTLLGNLVLILGVVLQKGFINTNNVLTACLYRWLVGFTIFQPIALYTWKSSERKFEIRSLVYVIVWLVSYGMYFYLEEFSLMFIPASSSTAIIGTSSIMVSVISPMISDEKFKITTVFGSVLGVSGLFVISKPAFLFGEGNQLNVTGVLVTLLSAIGYAVSCLLSKKILFANLYLLNYIMYAVLTVTTSMSMISNVNLFHLNCDVSPFLVIGSMLAINLGMLMVNFAYRLGENGPQSVLGMCSIPFSFILDIIVNGYRPDKYAVIGIIVVLLALSSLFIKGIPHCDAKNSEDQVLPLRFSRLNDPSDTITENRSTYGTVE